MKRRDFLKIIPAIPAVFVDEAKYREEADELVQPIEEIDRGTLAEVIFNLNDRIKQLEARNGRRKNSKWILKKYPAGNGRSKD